MRSTALQAQARAVEVLSNIQIVQAHTAEPAEARAYTALLQECCEVWTSGALVVAMLRQVATAITLLSDVIILAVRAAIECAASTVICSCTRACAWAACSSARIAS